MAEKYVFISYSSIDEPAVKRLTKLLMDNRYTYWKAPEMIPVGSNYAKVIPSAIADCAAFVLIVSRNSQNSIWVEKEIDCAINNRKQIIPIDIDGSPLNDMLKFFLNNVQTIPYYLDAANGQRMIIKAVGAVLGGQQPSEVRPSNNLNESSTRPAVMPMDNRIAPGSQGRRQLEPTLTPGMARKLKKEALLKEYGTKNEQEQLKERQLAEKRKRWNSLNNRDAFEKIKKLLNEKGPLQVDEIYYETGIPKEIIKDYIREERLEIPSNMPATLVCEKCGKRIRTGFLCSECKVQRLGSGPRKNGNFHTRY